MNPSDETHKIKVWGVLDVLMFLKLVFYSHQGCIYLIKNTVLLIVKCLIYSCNGKLLHTLVSHDSSETILICWFGYNSTLENSLCCLFLWKWWYFIFRTFKKNRMSKRKAFIWIIFFVTTFYCHLINLMHPCYIHIIYEGIIFNIVRLK